MSRKANPLLNNYHLPATHPLRKNLLQMAIPFGQVYGAAMSFLQATVKFFNTENRFSRAYKRIFSIREIESDIALKWFAGAILLGYLIRFNNWYGNQQITIEAVQRKAYVCWPFFPGCGKYYWLSTLPYGYSQPILFMAIFGVMVAAVYAIYQNRWAWVHAAIMVLFLFRCYVMALSYFPKGNYDYYAFLFSFIFLFLPHKRFFAQLSLVTFYFISTAAKIHPSWTVGTYFSAMKYGLPIFGKGAEIFYTNLVIFMEMVMAWFLFSARAWLQRAMLAFFIVFHLYSGTLVAYLYPTTVLPPLIILFGPWFKPYRQVPLDKRSLPGWLLIGTLMATPIIPRLIPGDEKITLEGNFYSLYMFEANHQCVVTLSANGKNLYNNNTVSARDRCDPYEYYFILKNLYCGNPGLAPLHFVMDSSINGGPFYRIIDEPNLCSLTYKPFSHNSWIHDPATAPMVGRAMENSYR